MYHYTTVTISQPYDVIQLFIVMDHCLLSSFCEGVTMETEQGWLGDG